MKPKRTKDKVSGIFISYRNEGGFPTANHLAEKLERDGYKIIFDKSSLRESGRFDEKIKSQIEACTDFVLILDRNAFERTSLGNPKETDWLRRELAYALKLKKNIIPIMLTGFTWPKELPPDIENVRNHNGPKYSRDYFDKFYNELLSFLKSRRTESPQSEASPPVKKYLWKIATGLLVLFLAVIAVFYYLRAEKNKELESTIKNDQEQIEDYKTTIENLNKKKPVLLFAGGGSVKGFILDSVDSTGTAFDNGIYMPMASAAAWPLVAEELSVGCYEKFNEQNPRPYFLVLLSGEKVVLNEMMIEKTRTEFLNRIGYLVEIQLGESPLQVAFQNVPELDNLFNRDKKVSSSELKKILCNSKYPIYATTQKTSATWRKYNSILGSKLDNLNVDFFEKKDEDFEKSYIILESKTYFAENVDTSYEGVHRIEVCDSVKQPVTCPMYVYFIAYRLSAGNGYVIPQPVRSFLTKLGINGFPKDNDKSLKPGHGLDLIRQYDMKKKCFVDQKPN